MTLSLLGEELASSIAGLLPSLIGAVILLAIGWAVGKALGKITEEILKRSKVDEYIFKTKKPLLSITKITTIVVSWSIYLLFMQASVDVLGVKSLASGLGAIVDFLPRLIGAVYIVVAGYAIAEIVKRRMDESFSTYGGMIKRLVYWLIIYISFTIALPMIGINAFILEAILIIFLASFAISFGIASSSIMKNELERIIKHSKKKKSRKRSK